MSHETLDFTSERWDHTPYRIWSLWEVLQTYAWNLVNHTETLTVVREDLKDRLNAERGISHRSASVLEEDKENIRTVLDLMHVWMDRHELHASLDRANRILEMLTEPEPVAIELIPALKTLSEVLEDELKRRFFLYLPPDDAKLYQQPLGLFPKAVDAFQSTRSNIINACRCHALGQSTACVFHCMGILQSGLYSLANKLGVIFQFPLTLAEWHNIIDNIESKISDLRSLPKGQAKDDLLTFYSGGAVQFRYFKDAWRNHVAHLREEYDPDQARSILTHTCDFMEHLSENLREMPIPKLDINQPPGTGSVQ